MCSVVGFVLLLGSCAELADREQGVCGNGIAEPESLEYCDGQEDCVSAGAAAGACFWSCAEHDCPDGFVCGMDDVCRLPGFDFERGDPVGERRVVWVEARDMDGDGRDDLVSIEADEGAGYGDLVVTFSDATGPGAQRWEWPSVTSTPEIGDANGDGLLDLVLVVRARLPSEDDDDDSGALVLLNDGARGFASVAAVTHLASRPDSFEFQTRPRAGGGRDVPVVGYVSSAADETGRFWDVVDGGDRDLLSPAKRGTTTLVYNQENDAGAADPCKVPRIAFGQYKDDKDTPDNENLELEVLGLCDDPQGEPNAQGVVSLSTVRVPGDDPTVRMRWAAFEHINDDGFVDLMTGVWAQTEGCERCVAVAYGVGDGTFDSNPDALPTSNGDGLFDVEGWHPYDAPAANPEVRAYGDLNGDGLTDYLLENFLALSKPGACLDELLPGCGCGRDRICVGSQESASWVRGVFADLDDEPGPEVVGVRAYGLGPNRDLVVLKVDGHEVTSTKLETTGSPEGLVAADLNADGATDVAVSLVSDEGGDRVGVIWGGAWPPVVQPATKGVPLPAVVGLAAEGVVGTQSAEDRLLALVGLPSDENPDLTGIVRLFGDAESRLVAPLGATKGGVARVRLGDFGTEGDAELLFSRRDYELQRVAPSYVPGIVAAATLSKSGPVHGNLNYLPAGSADSMEVLVGDLDDDGREDVVRFGASNEPGLSEGITWFETSSVRDGRWAITSSDYSDYLTVSGRWPSSERPSMSELRDVDGDGSLDLFALARLRIPGSDAPDILEDRAPVVWFGDAENGLTRPQFVSDEDAPLSDVRTWSFVGGEGSLSTVFFVMNGTAYVGAFNGETGELALVEEHDVPGDTSWSTVGDFDGDGLRDVGLATGTGIVPFFGRSAFSDPELMWSGAYFDPASAPVEPPESDPAVFYVNFEGGYFEYGATDATLNDYNELGFAGGIEVAPYGIGPARAEFLGELRDHWKDFNVWVTDVRPTDGEYAMVVVNPTYPPVPPGATYTIGDRIGCPDPWPSPIVWQTGSAWDDAFWVRGAPTHSSAWLAYAHGLEPSSDKNDLTKSQGDAKADATFQDDCVPLEGPSVCPPDHHWHECGPNEQNPKRELLELFGPADD